jgi:hypothetical protein
MLKSSKQLVASNTLLLFQKTGMCTHGVEGRMELLATRMTVM